MRKEARLLLDRALGALTLSIDHFNRWIASARQAHDQGAAATLSIDHFNRPWNVARPEAVLIQLER